MRRWRQYFIERFPLARNATLVFAFSFSALIYSRVLRGEFDFPEWPQLIVGFVTAFLFFLQLRIADEFKDFEEDSLYRPYRPVPRGLIKLSELRWLFGACAAIQFLLAIWLLPMLVALLGVTWLYLAAMSREFFVREWLKSRPITYLWTHMIIMPLIDLYVTSCDWLVSGLNVPPRGLIWLLVLSFFNGVLLEVGRKLRAEKDEEKGVDTYTALWGISKATLAWMVILVLNFTAALVAAVQTDSVVIAAPVLLVCLCFGFYSGVRFIIHPDTKHAKALENISGVWTLIMYLTVGPLALLYHL